MDKKRTFLHSEMASTGTAAFVLLFLIGQIDGRQRSRKEQPILYTDCGSSDKVIHFTQLQAQPVRLRLPGTLHVSLAGNVTSDLPRRMDVYLKIRKYIFGFPILVPCLSDGVGSCSYENICNTLEHYEREGCPEALRHRGYSCHCPFQAGEFVAKNVALTIPIIQGFAGTLLHGDYELELTLQEEDGPQLGCLRVAFAVRKRRRGWLFKI